MKPKLFYAFATIAAFLLFSVQPMVGRNILPLIGGAAQGWLISLSFFQLALLCGYCLVFFTRKWPAKRVGYLVAGGMAMGVLWLFMPQPDSFSAQSHFGLFWFLVQWVGLPLWLLGTVAPLIQRLFFTKFHTSPYVLYALSNAGSFAGLFAYPLIIEPFFSLDTQLMLWQAGFAVCCLLLAMCAYVTPAQDAPAKDISKVDLKTFLFWCLLACLPVSLLSSSSALLSTDVGSFAFVWVVPLGLYLATYIAAFKGVAGARFIQFGMLCGLILIGLRVTYLHFHFTTYSFAFYGLVLAAFTAAAFACHAKAYAMRPDAHNLPVFYLALALGGAVGGAFNAFLVPVIFVQPIEFYLVLSCAVLLTQKTTAIKIHGLKFGLSAVALLVLWLCTQGHMSESLRFVGLYAIIMLWMWPPVFVGTVVICLLWQCFGVVGQGNVLYQTRNYFGVWRVTQNANDAHRQLIHGTTLHGHQDMNMPINALEPTLYYGKAGSLGQVLSRMKAGRMGAVGLGVGQMACYAKEGWSVDFYELDADAVRIAKDWFNYLEACPPDNIFVGDARLVLKGQDATQPYDVLVLDAFSSDALPQHLLTREALALYRARVTDDGAILFHISSRYVDLSGMLSALAREAGLHIRTHIHRPAKGDESNAISNWVVMSADETLLNALADAGWDTPLPAKGWRDNHAPLWPVLQFFKDKNANGA